MHILKSFVISVASIFVFISGAQSQGSEIFGGWEGDSHNVGYSYLGVGTNLISNSKVALIGRLTGSYLYYEYDQLNSSVEFTSPGISLHTGIKLRIRKSTVILSSGAEYRWSRENIKATSSEIEERQNKYKLGAVTQGFLFAPLANNTHLMLLVSYDGANQYLFSRATLRQEFSISAPPIGFEGTGQGNDDITSIQLGAFIESPRISNSVSLKLGGGYKKSWFPDNLEESGVYAGLSLYGTF